MNTPLLRSTRRLLISLLWIFLMMISEVVAGTVTLELKTTREVTFVGAIRRWDGDGQALAPVDPRAKIDQPEVKQQATRQPGNRWVLTNLPAGRYDLVILTEDRIRLEGFHYPPLAEFDPFLPGTGTAPEKARDWIVKDIAAAKHFENHVRPLFLAGDEKQVRVFVQLVRDQPTSFDSQYGTPVATARHEIWQYTWWYGGWTRDKKTRVLNRVLMPKKDFQRWSWIWEPRLGGIEVKENPIQITYEVPEKLTPQTAKGWIGLVP